MAFLTQGKIMEALRRGDRIMVTNPDPMKAEDRIRYSMVSGAGSVRAATFRKILPDLKPQPDGLLPEVSQCFGLAK